MVSLVNSHTHATIIGWHLWEIDLRFAPGLPPGWGGLPDALPALPRAEIPEPGLGFRNDDGALPLEAAGGGEAGLRFRVWVYGFRGLGVGD